MDDFDKRPHNGANMHPHKPSHHHNVVSIVRGNSNILQNSVSYNIVECFLTTSDQARKGVIKHCLSWSKESQAEIDKMVEKVVRLAGGLPVKRGDTVLLKPNIVQPPHVAMFNSSVASLDMTQAAITDPRVVISVAKMCRDMGAYKVIIAERTASSIGNVFYECGYDNALAEINDPMIRVRNLVYERCIPMRSSLNLALESYAVPSRLGPTDVVISIAPLKTHMFAGTTLTLKNFVGLVSGEIYGNFKSAIPHGSLAEVICDLYSIVKKSTRNVFGIISGIVGGEGVGPLLPAPVPMNMVIAGHDLVAVDAVGTVVMGFDATAMGYLNTAERYNLGSMKNIQVIGAELRDVQKAFAPVPEQNRWPGGRVTNWESQIGRSLP